jgi:mRNA interferase RelE/StbE
VNYLVLFGRRAKKDVKDLDVATIKRIEKRLDELSKNPFDTRTSKPLKMFPGRRSSRVGDWRIVYLVHENDKIVFITAIQSRQEDYNNL